MVPLRCLQHEWVRVSLHYAQAWQLLKHPYGAKVTDGCRSAPWPGVVYNIASGRRARYLAVKQARQAGDMKGKILIVDDNAAIVEMLQRKLEREEYEVVGCVESTQALGTCRETRPDLLILDILMPGKNGWEILEELKADPATRDIPVIISTVKNRPEDIERGKELQAADHIAKPYVFSDLLEKVQAILGGS